MGHLANLHHELAVKAFRLVWEQTTMRCTVKHEVDNFIRAPSANMGEKGENHFNQLSECDLLNASGARRSTLHIKIGLIFFAESPT